MLRGHGWVVVAALAVVAVGMAFSVAWEPVVRGVPAWITPGDVWGTFREAHIVAWGGEGILYQQITTGFISFPGIAVVLAPVAMVSSALHLSESYPFVLQYPSAWLLLGPAEMALGSVALFPLDTLAVRLGMPRRRRIALIWLEAAAIWPSVALWGHPEDLVALAFALYGVMAAVDGKSKKCAILFGAAVAFQPLTILLVPIAFAYVPFRQWLRSAAVVVAPSALLLVAPLVHAWRTTIYALVDQPTFPTVMHPTPWVALSPVLARGRVSQSRLAHVNGAVVVMHSTTHAVEVVAGGPSRLFAVGLAIVLGVVVWRKRPALRTVMWLAALALVGRCLFESVMVAYYLVPGLALCLLVAASVSRRRLAAAAVCAAACTVLSYAVLDRWAYYLGVAGLSLATWGLARPPGAIASTSSEVSPHAVGAPQPVAALLTGAASPV